MLLRLNDEEIESRLSVSDFVASCDEAFRLYGQGEMRNPSREERLTREGGLDLFRLVFPGEWMGRYRGRKVIEERSDVKTGRMGDRTAVIELEDVQSGQKTVLDAEYITNMRTGAAGILGIRYLGKEDVEILAILGTGRIARALALCADTALGLHMIRATSRTAEKRTAFEAALVPQLSCPLQMAESIASCVDGADAVLAAVPTPEPILRALPAEMHVSVIGGEARTEQLDPALMLGREVVADHPEQAKKSGDFLALRNREVAWVRDASGRVQTIGDAALGRLEDRRGTGTIAYFMGMAIQDLHAAAMVVEKG